MTGNNFHRLNWPWLLCWLLKMDDHGGLPAWWQWPIPRYGNWGGIGWSAGRWLKTGDTTDWNVPPIDAMDEAFKDHDAQYREGGDRYLGDRILVATLRLTPTVGWYAAVYRLIAMLAFRFQAWCRTQ